jgi:sugar phosphate isomerase/epimerase
MLQQAGFDGVLSLECEGQGGPMIERSLAWVRDAVGAVEQAVAVKEN